MDTQRLAVRVRNILIATVVVLFGTVSVAFASLTLSGTGITGDASFVSFTGATSTIFDVGSGKTLSLQTTNNGPITTGSGLFTIGGRVSQTGLGGSTFFGEGAGNSDDLTNNINTGVGYQALYSNTTGIRNVAFGYQALNANTTGSRNNALGYLALGLNSIGVENTAFGNYASYRAATGNYATAVGSYAASENTGPTSSVAVGAYAAWGGSSYSAAFFTAVGSEALMNMTTGALNNTALGYESGYAISTGDNNVLIGHKAAYTLTTGSNNIVIGYDIDLPAINSANMLNIGNLIYGTSVSGSGTTVSTAGRVGIATTTPQARLHVANATTSIVSDTSFTPSLSTSTCVTGMMAWDANYFYMCVSANTWRRATSSAF